MARLIDVASTQTAIALYMAENSYLNDTALDVLKMVAKWLEEAPTVEAVRCRECLFAKPYERTDGETGYYCHFCGHSFKYGTNWERVFNPIKEADDFCSYGERRCKDG